MNKQDWKYLWFFMKDIAAREKKTVLELIVMGLTEAATPFISIVGMGALLDGIYAGAGKDTLIQYVMIILGSILFCRLLGAGATERFNRKLNYTKDLESRELNRQALSMDYEHLENIHVQELRSRAMAKSALGIRGWFVWIAHSFVKNLATVAAAFGILLPTLWKTENTADVPYFFWISAALYLVIGVMIWGNCKISLQWTRKASDVWNAMDGDNNKKDIFPICWRGWNPKRICA